MQKSHKLDAKILNIGLVQTCMPGTSDLDSTRLAEVFNALGNPVRLKILRIITDTQRPLHIKAVAKMLQMDYAAVYRHVDVLKKAGLLQIFEVGRSRVLSPLRGEILEQLFSLGHQIETE